MISVDLLPNIIAYVANPLHMRLVSHHCRQCVDDELATRVHRWPTLCAVPSIAKRAVDTRIVTWGRGLEHYIKYANTDVVAHAVGSTCSDWDFVLGRIINSQRVDLWDIAYYDLPPYLQKMYTQLYYDQIIPMLAANKRSMYRFINSCEPAMRTGWLAEAHRGGHIHVSDVRYMSLRTALDAAHVTIPELAILIIAWMAVVAAFTMTLIVMFVVAGVWRASGTRGT